MRFLEAKTTIREKKVTPYIDGQTLVWNPMKKDIKDCVGSIGSYTLGYIGGMDVVYVIIDGVEMDKEEANEALKEHIADCGDCYVESHYSVCEQHEEWGYVEGCPYCHSNHVQHLCDEGKLLEHALNQFE